MITTHLQLFVAREFYQVQILIIKLYVCVCMQYKNWHTCNYALHPIQLQLHGYCPLSYYRLDGNQPPSYQQRYYLNL